MHSERRSWDVINTQLNRLASLAKGLKVGLQTKWLWVRVPLKSMKLQILLLFQTRNSLTVRYLENADSL